MIPLYTAGLLSTACRLLLLMISPRVLTLSMFQNAGNASSARAGRLICAEKVRGSHPFHGVRAQDAHISHTPAVRATQGQGLMPDKTSRFSINGQKILHFVCVFIAYFLSPIN